MKVRLSKNWISCLPRTEKSLSKKSDQPLFIVGVLFRSPSQPGCSAKIWGTSSAIFLGNNLSGFHPKFVWKNDSSPNILLVYPLFFFLN